MGTLASQSIKILLDTVDVTWQSLITVMSQSYSQDREFRYSDMSSRKLVDKLSTDGGAVMAVGQDTKW